MNKTIWLVLLLLIFFSSNGAAKSLENGKCYQIDGPANIRNEINGKIVDSLPHGKIVRIKKSLNSDWYKIEYLKYSHDNNCPPCEDQRLREGWTHKQNIDQIKKIVTEDLHKFKRELPLIELIEQRKVIIGKEVLWPEDINNFLDKKIDLHKGYGELGERKIINLTNPIPINVYSLKGQKYSNEIISFEVIYDAGKKDVSINTKYVLPDGYCILVNGTINELNRVENKEKTFNLPLRFPNPPRVKWIFEAGDFNKDGILEILSIEICHIGPYYSVWKIYQDGASAKTSEVYNIGYYGHP